MAKNLVEIYNLALSSVGTRASVSLPSERSREAEICNLWYPLVRDKVLRAAPWASARASELLAVKAQRVSGRLWQKGDPEPDWNFTYSLPADFLYPRYLQNFNQFFLADDNGQPIMYANVPNAILIYTKKQELPSAWDSALYNAIIHALAAHITMPLNGKVQTASFAMQKANEAIINARIETANENQIEYDSLPDWLIARGTNVSARPNRFIYQNGPLFSSLGGQ